jgi:hypothetical protein
MGAGLFYSDVLPVLLGTAELYGRGTPVRVEGRAHAAPQPPPMRLVEQRLRLGGKNHVDYSLYYPHRNEIREGDEVTLYLLPHTRIAIDAERVGDGTQE